MRYRNTMHFKASLVLPLSFICGDGGPRSCKRKELHSALFKKPCLEAEENMQFLIGTDPVCPRTARR